MSLFGTLYSAKMDTTSGMCKIGEIEYLGVGLGTYRLTGKVCTHALQMAIKAGYQIIDTATFYENFQGIAKAFQGQERGRFYIISKVWHDQQAPEDLQKDLDKTLKQLEMDYLDAYLLHWPNHKIPIEGTLAVMEEMRQAKKIRHIGLSNVSVNHIKRALEMKVPITWVQVEMHPFFYDKALLDFCHEHGIMIQAYRPLNLGRTSQDEMLLEIGKKYHKTASQIALRWILQHGCLPLPGSGHEKHMKENLDIRDFVLSSEEMQAIDKRAEMGSRFRLTEEHGLGFVDEFDFSYEECWPKPS